MATPKALETRFVGTAAAHLSASAITEMGLVRLGLLIPQQQTVTLQAGKERLSPCESQSQSHLPTFVRGTMLRNGPQPTKTNFATVAKFISFHLKKGA